MNNTRLAMLESKWLDGSISEEEAREYALWYNSGQNDPLEVPENIAESKAEHQQKMFTNISNAAHLTSPKEEEIRLPVRNFSKYAYVAAATVILLVAGIFWQNKMHKKASSPAIAHDIKPGHPGLILTLDNGQKIMLDSMKDGAITVQNGIQIIKKDGTLRYTGSGSSTGYNVASTAEGRQFRIELPDGSMVSLNAASSIKYPLAFNSAERVVEITGEVYFEIVHTKNNQPFIVKVGDQQIKVLGTHFNVNAYPDEPNIITTLQQGKIQIKTGNSEAIIKPGEKAITSHSSDSIKVEASNAEKAVSWTQGKFTFDNANLGTVMRQIERWYGVKVIYKAVANQDIRFSGTTPMNQNLSEVLKVLELSGIHLSTEGKTITVLP